MNTIKTTQAKNGQTYYYLDGKRISQAKALELMAQVETATPANDEPKVQAPSVQVTPNGLPRFDFVAKQTFVGKCGVEYTLNRHRVANNLGMYATYHTLWAFGEQQNIFAPESADMTAYKKHLARHLAQHRPSGHKLTPNIGNVKMSNFKRKPLIISPNADAMPRIEKPYTYATLNNDRTITLSDEVKEMAIITTTSDIITLATGSRPLKSCFFNADRLPFAENAHEFLDTYGEKTGGDETTTFYLFNGYEYAVLIDNTVMTITEYNSIADADADADVTISEYDVPTENAPQIPSLLKKVQTMLFDGLNELDEPMVCDIHNYIYNASYAYIYTADAKKALAELDVWQAIATIKAYEQSAFGEVSTDLTDPVKVANMLVFIVGEVMLHKIFGNTQFFGESWDSYTDAEMLADMRDWALQRLDGEPNLMLDIWHECVEQY